MPSYCEIALPVPLRTTFTYAVPDSLSGAVELGCRVVVPFGKKALVGIALEAHDRKPQVARIREIVEVLDPIPAIPSRLLELGRWVAGYYVAPIGEVFRAMLPPQEVRAERILQITESGAEYLDMLDSFVERTEGQVNDRALLQLLEKEGKPVRDSVVRRLPGGAAAEGRLLRLGHIVAEEVARHRKTRMQRIVAWNPTYSGEAKTNAESRIREILTAERGPLSLADLLEFANVSASVVKRLERNGALTSWEETLDAGSSIYESELEPPTNLLNADQTTALQEINGWIAAGEFRAALLFGVTGSGKTEVYLRAVETALGQGRSALILVPEIALTPSVARLCRARFGPGVAVLHSGLPDAERAREWWRARRGEVRVVVGTRLAAFAPLENPGLIIVDEEQESSYKQEETPRYHGRDTAVMRAKLESAVALLASATPSLESFQNVRCGKYELLRLESRVEDRPLAAVQIVDMREDFRRTHKTSPFSETLRTGISARLQQDQQVLVLMNRRGYSWFVLCRSCGASVHCENCSIALTYHKGRNRLICHYCGAQRPVPKKCPKCESPHVYFVGQGAEQIEEQLKELMPDARIARLDRDTVRTRHAAHQILGAFARGDLDILVGTQMVAKGHDFHRVTLAGVVSADLQLGLPDFRAAERTFQLLTQVAGRAGRGALPGEVIVQTYYPGHYAIQLAARQDYESFFERELHFRRLMHYPPFAALASVIVRDKKVENAIKWSRVIAGHLAPAEDDQIKVLGPAAAPLARLRQDYRFQFLLKAPKRAQLTRTLAVCLDFCAKKEIPEKAVLVDVDPVSLL
jgi:primosomal protein N' (replication factor Y)